MEYFFLICLHTRKKKLWAIRTDLGLEHDDLNHCIKSERMRDTILVVFAHEWIFDTITQFICLSDDDMT